MISKIKDYSGKIFCDIRYFWVNYVIISVKFNTVNCQNSYTPFRDPRTEKLVHAVVGPAVDGPAIR